MRRRAAAAAVLVVVLGVACSSGDGNDDSSAPAKATTTTRDRSATGELVYLVPTKLPEGMKVSSTTLSVSGEQKGGWAVVLGIPQGAGFRGVIRASVSAADKDREVSPSEAKLVRRVRVGAVTARYEEQDLIGATIDWFTGGRAVRVFGPRELGDTVTDVARRLRLGPADNLTVTRLEGVPAGYQVIGSGGVDSLPRREYSIHGAGPSPATFTLSVAVVPQAIDVLTLGVGPDIAFRQLRGTRVAVSGLSATVNGQTFSTNNMTWRERDDIVITLQGLLSVDDLALIAEGLQERPEAQWRRELKVRDQPTPVSTTTARR